MANPSTFKWTDPTTNVDGTAVTTGEITGYTIGIRPSTGTVGTYPTLVNVSGASATSAALPTLAAGTYDAAIMSVGPINSAWSAEVSFTIAETPNPPSGFSVA
jgi:hypothetical protein